MSKFTDEEKQFFIKVHGVDGRLFEDVTTQFYNRWCQKGDTVIDGGANHGHHTFQLADVVGPEGTVFAIEAVPMLAVQIDDLLHQTNRKNVKLVCAALGRETGTAEFFHRRDMDGWSSLFDKHVPPNTDEGNISRFIAPLVTLDMLAEHMHGCTFMKLDLELNEFPALQSAEALLSNMRPLIVFENSRQHAANIAGFTKDEFFEYFERLNYRVFDIFMDPLTPDRWQGDPTVPVYCVAVHEDQVGSVLDLPIRDMLSECYAAQQG